MRKLFLAAIIILCGAAVYGQSVKSQAFQLSKNINTWIATSRAHEPKPADISNPKWVPYGIQLQNEWDAKFSGDVHVLSTWLWGKYPAGSCSSEHFMNRTPVDVLTLRQRCADKILDAANKLEGK